MYRAARRSLAVAVAVSGPQIYYNRQRYSVVRAKAALNENITPVEVNLVASESSELKPEDLVSSIKNQSVETEELTNPVDVFKVKVYGYFGCPFCGKVRAILDYYGFEYEDFEVNPFTKKELKEIAPEYKKVPVVQFIREDTNQVFTIKDSGVVASIINQAVNENRTDLDVLSNQFESSDLQPLKNDEDREFVDNQILHTIAPNLYPNWREATMNALMLQEKSPNYADTKTGRAIAYSSAAVMIFIGNKILKKWRDNPDQTAREYLYSGADKLLIRKGDEMYLGGSRPSLADIEAYGIVSTLEGTDAMVELSNFKPIFFQWYNAVHRHVTTHQGRP